MKRATVLALAGALLLARGVLGIAQEKLRAGFLIENGVYNSELIAPLDVLHHTPFHAKPGIEVCTIGPTKDPITTFEALRITPDYDYRSAPPLDVLVVPSAERHVGEGFDDPALIEFVRERAKSARFVMSLCDGAFVLAKAGLLDGRRCTTFPGDVPALRARHPKAHVLDGVSFVVDGNVITSVGGAGSYDPALYVVETLYGEDPAVGVARGLVIDWNLERVAHYVHQPGQQRSYDVLDVVDRDVTVEDEAGRSYRVLDLPRAEDRVVVLFFFGGGEHEGEARRGGLWCEDSQDEMALVHHLSVRFGGQGVAFIPIACPPVLHEKQFGYEEGGFSRSAERFEAQRQRFVAATQRAIATGVIPFETVYYDPTFELLGKVPSGASGNSPAAGRFRARDEWQKYGTPTIWILSRDGRVLLPPFHGNNYELAERKLRYGDREVSRAIERALVTTSEG